MKQHKKIFISLFIACSFFLFGTDKVWAGENFGGSAESLGYDTSDGSSSNHGFAACNWEEHSHTRDAGLLITILSYDAGSNTETVLGSRYLKTSGAWGGYTYKVTKQCSQEVKRNDYKETSGVGCGNSHTVEDLERTTITVKWGSPSFSKSIKEADGEVVINGLKAAPSFTGGSLKKYVENYLLDEVFGGKNLKETIDKINSIMQLSGNKKLKQSDYTKYYLKVEPIYRVFPAVSKVTPCANCSDKDTAEAKKQTESCEHTYITCHSKDSEGNCTSGSVNSSCGASTPCGVTGNSCKLDWYLKEMSTQYGVNISDSGQVSGSGLGGSYVTTARDNNGYSAYMRALFVSETNNVHEVVSEDATTKIGNDYYIGYNYLNAIAMGSSGVHKYSPKNNIYKLLTNIETAPKEYSGNNKTTVGMAIYSLLDFNKMPSCISMCEKYDKNHASDEYLKCASNFCDTQVVLNDTTSGTVLKRSCILDVDQCDYHPAKPIDCNNNSTNHKTIVSTRNGGHSEEGYNRQVTSYCGFTDTNRSNSSTVNEGAYQFCERQGTDIYESRTDGKLVYDYQDSNSYINISCMETATAQFKDLSNTTLRPGKAVEGYGGNLTASRSCEVFYDYVSWKLDFASTHANDTTRKVMMLEKINAFNTLANSDKETDTVNGSEQFQREGKAILGTNKKKITVNDLEGGDLIAKVKDLRITNDEEKTNVKTIVEEVVENKKSTKGMDPYGGEVKLEIVNNDKKGETSKSGSTNYDKNKATLVLDYNMEAKRNKAGIGYKSINTYTFSSGLYNEYQMPDVCVRDDGSAKVELLKKDKTECSSYIGGSNYSSHRNYYTSKLATPNKDITDKTNLKHQFITTATINTNKLKGTISNTNYFTNTETCDYKIDDGSAEPGIELVPEPGSPISVCTSVYDVGYVIANILYKDVSLPEGVTVKNHGISDITGKEYGKSTPNGASQTHINAKAITINESNGIIKTTGDVSVIEAVIEDTEGNKYYSQREITLLGNASNKCTISIEKDARYKITTSANEIYYATSNMRNSNGGLVWNKVKRNNNEVVFNVYNKDQGIYVALRNGNKLELCASYTNNVKCTDCRDAIKNRDDNTEVRNYCHNYWTTDVRNPKTEDACFSMCKTGCPITCDEKTIKSWCTTNWEKEEYKSSDECISDCNCIKENKAVYRPINEYNPFPYSETVGLNYNSGDRLIGKNWYGKEYIIMDNAEKNYTDKPLYEVELSVTDLAAIRNDTKSYYDAGKDPYVSRETYSKSGRCLLPDVNGYIYKGYCSALIHESQISNRFTKVRGQ